MKDSIDKALNMLGFAARARKLCFGAQAVESAIKRRKTILVILDSEISENTYNRLSNICKHNDVGLIKLPQPGYAAGKPESMCIAVLDDGFAVKINNLAKMGEINVR